ncbi:hypothetical protein [Clostridium sp. JS66]|uniref:hypothetical protein n=1 Tax=Clostridium sp. JS66 TaxID=3064705 RepID=UPI00298E1497|nr:hypothetical protein [Clostridium sp. JS66]WPC42941.1 hypothetical protein Q6H37_05570 [Clostridium sp. JS66]
MREEKDVINLKTLLEVQEITNILMERGLITLDDWNERMIKRINNDSDVINQDEIEFLKSFYK